MGTVYRAVHRRHRRPYALKVLPGEMARDETFVARFRREAGVMAELRHPNIVYVEDAGEANGHYYIAMRLVEGRSLAELLDEGGPLPVWRALKLLAQLASALDCAHQRGIAHRDVKPSNIMVGPQDHVTLLDFGLAWASETARLTRVGAVVGTPQFTAPETIVRGEAGPSVDLYALGVLSYLMLTGRVPFDGPPAQVLRAQLKDQPLPPGLLRPGLPPGADDVLLRQLAKRPDQRYPSASSFVTALQRSFDSAARHRRGFRDAGSQVSTARDATDAFIGALRTSSRGQPGTPQVALRHWWPMYLLVVFAVAGAIAWLLAGGGSP
jgi:serine/threonine-protein kinase